MASAIITAAAFLLASLLILFLPLHLSGKQKLAILLASILIGLIGVLGKMVYAIWQSIVFQVVLALGFTYFMSKKFEPFEEEKIDESEIQPMFSLEELEENAKNFQTIDTYYSSIPKIQPVSEPLSEQPTIVTEGFPKVIKAAETEIKTVPMTENEIERLIERDKELVVKEIEPILIEHALDDKYTVEPIDFSEELLEIRKHTEEPLLIAKNAMNQIDDNPESSGTEDDAELLIKARLEMFSEMDGKSPILETQLSDGIPVDKVEYQISDDKEDIIEELDQNQLGKRVKIFEELERPSGQFDDLEEIYLKRKKVGSV